MRKAFVLAAAVAAPVLALVPVSSATAKPSSHGTVTVAVYGDAPYGTSNIDTAEFPHRVPADPVDLHLLAYVRD